MRSLGLLVDGPARWGARVASRRPGVFAVELPAAPESAPIEIVAVRRWIERVRDLALNGERPSPHDLARWLAGFWLPGEPVLFVGRSTKSIGARLSAIYATPLGDVRPSSAGHWLKALSLQSEMRVWWTETDAHEEYEDALLSEISVRCGERLPFANLATTDGAVKAADLANSLRSIGDDASARQTLSAPASTRRAAPRPAVARRSPRRTADVAVRPMTEPAHLSREGLDRLTAELDDLRTTVRPQIIARVKAARELGDLRENGDYEYARKEQSFVEGRILALEQTIKHSVMVDEPRVGGAARIGSTVVLTEGGEEHQFTIVSTAEAEPSRGRISDVSPVGRAVVGAHAGDEVVVELPNGRTSYVVREVR